MDNETTNPIHTNEFDFTPFVNKSPAEKRLIFESNRADVFQKKGILSY